jgi:predicted nuclease of predicted toxin-antitoxin system
MHVQEHIDRLIDNQSPKALAEHLRARGHDCQHVLDAGLADASDISIYRHAEAQERILVSKDEDFLYLSNLPMPHPRTRGHQRLTFLQYSR